MKDVIKGRAWALALATSLLVLAVMTGRVPDGPGESALASDALFPVDISSQSDSGPQQAGCPLGLPWVLPVGDADCDGFSDTMELHAGTHAFCAAGLPSAWPADLSNDGYSDITDVSAMLENFGESIPNSPLRQDIAPEPAGDGTTDITDISVMTAVFGLRAADFLPLCPPA